MKDLGNDKVQEQEESHTSNTWRCRQLFWKWTYRPTFIRKIIVTDVYLFDQNGRLVKRNEGPSMMLSTIITSSNKDILIKHLFYDIK